MKQHTCIEEDLEAGVAYWLLELKLHEVDQQTPPPLAIFVIAKAMLL